MTGESPAIDIQADIAGAVRRHVQLPANGPVAPRPAGYQQRFAKLCRALDGGLILPVLMRNFSGPDGNLPHRQAEKYTSRRKKYN